MKREEVWTWKEDGRIRSKSIRTKKTGDNLVSSARRSLRVACPDALRCGGG